MSYAAQPSLLAAKSGSAHVVRMLMVVAALVAALLAGAAIFGHSSSVAASPVATSLPIGTGVASTDTSLPQASAVFSGQMTAAEEAGPTF